MIVLFENPLLPIHMICTAKSLSLALDIFFLTLKIMCVFTPQDLTALAKELRELRSNEETNRPPVKVTDYSSSSEESESSEEEEGEGGAHDGTVPVSDIPRIM